MSNAFGTVGLASAGIAINTTYTVAQKRDPFPTIFAGTLFMGGCLIVGGFNTELGTALAALYLLSTFITRGDYFIKFLENLTNAKSPKGK